MVFNSNYAAAFIALATAALPVAGQAQSALNNFGFETGVSTLGAYVAPKYALNDKLTVRAPIYFGSMNRTQTFEGNPVNGKFDTASGGLVADYHPFKGAFRISGGVALGGYNVTGDITNPKFEGTTYTGNVATTLKQTNDIVPVLSFGYAKTFKNGLGIVAEIGAKIGTYTFTASDTAIPAGQKAQFNSDVAKINSDLQKLPATPFVTLGLSYRF